MSEVPLYHSVEHDSERARICPAIVGLHSLR